jgi:hypothetical protein
MTSDADLGTFRFRAVHARHLAQAFAAAIVSVPAARFNGAADPAIDTTHPREVLEASPTDRFRPYRRGAVEP